jgi:hypothetical protein
MKVSARRRHQTQETREIEDDVNNNNSTRRIGSGCVRVCVADANLGARRCRRAALNFGICILWCRVGSQVEP